MTTTKRNATPQDIIDGRINIGFVGIRKAKVSGGRVWVRVNGVDKVVKYYETTDAAGTYGRYVAV